MLLVILCSKQPYAVCREHPAAHEAVAALARHIVMKSPDKADFRSLAADAAVGFIKELPAAAQSGYCAFLARLSRTPKVHQHAIAIPCPPHPTNPSARPPEATMATPADCSCAYRLCSSKSALMLLILKLLSLVHTSGIHPFGQGLQRVHRWCSA